MRAAVTMLLALAVSVAPRLASANCARPVTYEASVSDAGVLIEPQNFEGRACPDTEGLVRQNVATGEVVRIDTCAVDAGASFVDTCVPPGKYRYGFAPGPTRARRRLAGRIITSRSTSPTSFGAPGCVAPTHATLPAAPWSSDPEICTYSGRVAQVGLGVIVVVVALVGALVFGIIRMRRKRAS